MRQPSLHPGLWAGPTGRTTESAPGINSIACGGHLGQAASVRGQSNQVLSEVLRAGRASTAGLSPLSTPDSILICSVPCADLDCARLAATRGRNPADLLRQASSAAWGAGFVQASAAPITCEQGCLVSRLFPPSPAGRIPVECGSYADTSPKPSGPSASYNLRLMN